MIRTGEGIVLAHRVVFAKRPLARIRGLIGRPLGEGEALLIEPAAQVHTFGMAYPLDVVFCDRGSRVLHIRRALPPWRVTRWVRRARYAVELPAGSVPASLSPGDYLEVVI